MKIVIDDVSYGIQSDVLHYHIAVEEKGLFIVDKIVEIDANLWAVLYDTLCGLVVNKPPEDL